MAQRSWINTQDYPHNCVDLNGTGLTIHPVLGGLDRASRPIVPESRSCSALRNRRISACRWSLPDSIPLL